MRRRFSESSAIVCVITLFLAANCQTSHAQEYSLEKLYGAQKPLADVTFILTTRSDTVGIKEQTSEVRILDATHYSTRASAYDALEVFEGNSRTYTQWPSSESLTVADGKFLWLEVSKYDRSSKKGTYSLRRSDLTPNHAFQLPGPASPEGRALVTGMFDLKFQRLEMVEGRQSAVFAGKAIDTSSVPDMLKQYFGDAELILDAENGFIYSFIIHGGRNNRPTTLVRVSNIKWNAGLEAEEFAYAEEHVTEKALNKVIEGLDSAAAKELNDAMAALSAAPESDLPDFRLQYAAALALAEKGDPSAFRVLAHLLDKTNRDKRVAVVKALAKTKDPKAVDTLLELLKDPDGSTAAAAAAGLGEIGDRRATATLIALADDRDNPRRYSALDALFKMKDPASIECLGRALNAGGSPTADHAAMALIEMNDPKAKEIVVAALKGDIGNTMFAAARALATTKDTAVVEPLIECLKHKYPGQRMEAAKALAEIGDKRAVEFVIPMLKENQTGPRRTAAECLGKLGDPKAVDPLVAQLENERDSSVAQAIREALKKLGAEYKPAPPPATPASAAPDKAPPPQSVKSPDANAKPVPAALAAPHPAAGDQGSPAILAELATHTLPQAMSQSLQKMLTTPHVAKYREVFDADPRVPVMVEGEIASTGGESSFTVFWKNENAFRIESETASSSVEIRNGQPVPKSQIKRSTTIVETGFERIRERRSGNPVRIMVEKQEHGPELDWEDMVAFTASSMQVPVATWLTRLPDIYAWKDEGLEASEAGQRRYITARARPELYEKACREYLDMMPEEQKQSGMPTTIMGKPLPVFPDAIDIWIDPETQFIARLEFTIFAPVRASSDPKPPRSGMNMESLELVSPTATAFQYTAPEGATLREKMSSGPKSRTAAGRNELQQCIEAMRTSGPFTAHFTYSRFAFQPALSTGVIYFQDEDHYRVEAKIHYQISLKPMAFENLRRIPEELHILLRNGDQCKLFKKQESREWEIEELAKDWAEKARAEGDFLFSPNEPILPQLSMYFDASESFQLDRPIIQGARELTCVKGIWNWQKIPSYGAEGKNYKADLSRRALSQLGWQAYIDPVSRRFSGLRIWQSEDTCSIAFDITDWTPGAIAPALLDPSKVIPPPPAAAPPTEVSTVTPKPEPVMSPKPSVEPKAEPAMLPKPATQPTPEPVAPQPDKAAADRMKPNFPPLKLLPPPKIQDFGDFGIATPQLFNLHMPWQADFTCLRWSYNTAEYSGTIQYQDEEHYRIEYDSQAVESRSAIKVEELRQRPVVKHIIVRSGTECWHYFVPPGEKPVLEKLNADWRQKSFKNGHMLPDPRAPLGPQLKILSGYFQPWKQDGADALRTSMDIGKIMRDDSITKGAAKNNSIHDVKDHMVMKFDHKTRFPTDISIWCDKESASFSIHFSNMKIGKEVSPIHLDLPSGPDGTEQAGDPRQW